MKNVFSNFVPNYKNLATIFQIFNDKSTAKERVILENVLIENMTGHKEEMKKLKPVDKLVYKTFVNKFNSTYKEKILEEQKILLNKYILSFADNGLEFKIYLNEEIDKLKKQVTKLFELEEFLSDEEMTEKAKKVSEILEGFRNREIDKEAILSVLKIQNLIKEAELDGN